VIRAPSVSPRTFEFFLVECRQHASEGSLYPIDQEF
jgi:hypothetical protein